MKKLLCALSVCLALLLAVSCGTAGDGEDTAALSVPVTFSTQSPASETQEPTDTEREAEETERFIFSPSSVEYDAYAAYAALYCADTREVLYMKGDGTRIYPASTTKLLTALYALTVCAPTDIFTAGDELDLVAADSSIAYIKKGHRLSLDMLIEAMLLPSGNDAAYVVAAGVGRKLSADESPDGRQAVRVFIEGINSYCSDTLGLIHTNITCPDGYHDDEHYTCLRDMLVICEECLDSEIIMKYAKTVSESVTYASGEKNTWTNSNQLIDPASSFYLPGATGLKTGTTDEAGCCLAASSETGGKKYIALVFDAPSNDARFSDAHRLLSSVSAQ